MGIPCTSKAVAAVVVVAYNIVLHTIYRGRIGFILSYFKGVDGMFSHKEDISFDHYHSGDCVRYLSHFSTFHSMSEAIFSSGEKMATHCHRARLKPIPTTLKMRPRTPAHERSS